MTDIKFEGTIDVTKPIVVTDSAGTHTFVPQSTPPPPPPPTGTSGTIISWRGDAETGDLSQWARAVEAYPDRIKVVTSPVSQGKYAYRFELRPGDDAYGSRVQLDSGISGGANAHYIKNGDEGFYGISFYIPSASLAKVAKWRQFIQFKGVHTGSPPLQININDDYWRLYYRPTDTVSNIKKWQSTLPVRKNTWEKFMFHVKWSTDPTIGFVEMYYNGVLVVPKFFTANIHIKDGQPVDNIVDVGIYRDASITTTDITYADNFVAGRSYTEVAQ